MMETGLVDTQHRAVAWNCIDSAASKMLIKPLQRLLSAAMIPRKFLLPLFLAASLAVLPSVHGQIMTYTINPNAADGQVASDGAATPTYTVQDQGDYQCRIGELFAPGGACYVIPFQIPTLSAGQVFTAASLQMQLFALTGTPGNADLYALRVNTSAQPLTTDYYQGTNDTAHALLQANFLTPSSPVRTDPNMGPFITTSTDANNALVSFLNAADINNSAAGQYLFLRVSYDVDPIPGGNNAYSLLTEDAGGTNEKPILTLTSGTAAVVPEPSTLALLSLAGMGAVFFRRRE